jgi:hypothetical protein
MRQITIAAIAATLADVLNEVEASGESRVPLPADTRAGTAQIQRNLVSAGSADAS